MTAIKSQFNLPNGQGGYDTHHFETESAQVTDLPQTLAPYIKNITSDGAIFTLTKGDNTTVDLAVVADNAGAHNALFRGKDLTEYFDSGEMSEAIAAGTFEDIYPGDFIKKSVTVDGTTYTDVIWIVGDLDYHLHRGDTETTDHHVLLFPKNNIGTARMNATDVTTGGFLGSEMWKTTLPKYATGIKAAFGATHVLTHNEILTDTVNTSAASMAGAGLTGCSSHWIWTAVDVNLFNEPMVYGNPLLSSSFYDIGDCNTQVAAMRHDKSLSFTRQAWCWLRAVAYSAAFCLANYTGGADSLSASRAAGGVRPYFLLR